MAKPDSRTVASLLGEYAHRSSLRGGNPYRTKAYPNFMMDDEGEARLKATYGENYKRLGKLKKKYHPGNLFRVNHNIRPAA
ncbi:MAG: hypothetical protein EOS40_04655 [Mesorhizobium sp.]|nr:MAG: hypothetical protein EOS40_04655 [Mesorhizobium sp.]